MRATKRFAYAFVVACVLLPAHHSSAVPTHAARAAAAWSFHGAGSGRASAELWRRAGCCVALRGVVRGGHGEATGPDDAGGGGAGGPELASSQGKRPDTMPVGKEEARRQRNEGDMLYKRGKYHEAVLAYTAGLVADCSVQGAFGGRAAALLMTAQYGAALHDALCAVDAVKDGVQGTTGGELHRVDRLHAHLLLAKTLVAMGRGEEASVHYKQVIELSETCKTARHRRVAIECSQEARDGIRHARAYEALVRKAFTNLHQTRDMFYVPVVGRWRSWRKGSGTGDEALLPLGLALSLSHVSPNAHSIAPLLHTALAVGNSR